METIDTIRRIAEDVARRMKLEIFDVNFRKQKGKLFLDIVIDDPLGYVSIDQCEKFSREINPILDAESDISNYILEVSSPGLDRPLRKIEDFVRFKGKLAKIKFVDENGKNVSVIGKINGCDLNTGTFSMEVEGKTNSYVFSKVISANLVVEF